MSGISISYEELLEKFQEERCQHCTTPRPVYVDGSGVPYGYYCPLSDGDAELNVSIDEYKSIDLSCPYESMR